MLFFLFFILEVAHSDDTQQEVIKRVKVSFTSMFFFNASFRLCFNFSPVCVNLHVLLAENGS